MVIKLSEASNFIFAVLMLAGAPAGAEEYQLSFAPGGNDAGGRFMGGTELRLLVAHQGKLYAGNGYWEDRPGPEGPQGAEILVLDGPAAHWRVEHVFDDRLPGDRRRDFVVSALASLRFETDGTGTRLPHPVSMLAASTWDRTGATRVFTRDDTGGTWSATLLAQDTPQPNFLPQIRSFAQHRDRATQVDRIFAGLSPRGIFSGVYDSSAAGGIRWENEPELGFAAASRDANPGTADWLRVGGFAEANGTLYATLGQQIFVRDDGTKPSWRLLYTNARPGHSETGLRGLTTVANPAGKGQVLLAAVEGNAARVIRVDPSSGAETTELDLVDFLTKSWGVRATYVIAAYNDMARIAEPSGEALVIGLESFIPRPATLPAGQRSVDVGYGRLEAGGWYLIRHADRHYELKQIALPPTEARDLVAVRTAIASPFAGEAGVVYLGGYDANKVAAHNTAWIVRARGGP